MCLYWLLLCSCKRFVALKVVKSAQHYTETALDEIKLLKCVSTYAVLQGIPHHWFIGTGRRGSGFGDNREVQVAKSPEQLQPMRTTQIMFG